MSTCTKTFIWLRCVCRVKTTLSELNPGNSQQWIQETLWYILEVCGSAVVESLIVSLSLPFTHKHAHAYTHLHTRTLTHTPMLTHPCTYSKHIMHTHALACSPTCTWACARMYTHKIMEYAQHTMSLLCPRRFMNHVTYTTNAPSNIVSYVHCTQNRKLQQRELTAEKNNNVYSCHTTAGD